MGSLYTQHFAGGHRGGMVGGRRFELVYHGDLAGVSNTRPLFAALVKGLVSSISDAGGRDVNIVNATLIAKERGIAIDEKHVRDGGGGGPGATTFASAVTLRSLGPGGGPAAAAGEQVIEGYVSGNAVFISKLDRFTANFHPEGTLLVLHNYDEPGKIGNVGTVLGRHGINIRFMQVASLEDGRAGAAGNGHAEKEALMILGVDGEVTDAVLGELGKSEGILDVSLVKL